LRKDVIHSRHSVEEDLWEISGLPVPKGGPGSGCPKAGGSKTEKLDRISNNNSSYHTLCSGNQRGEFYAKVNLAYRPYAVYHELYQRFWFQLPTGYGYCDIPAIRVYKASWRGNKSGWGQVTINDMWYWQQNFTGSIVRQYTRHKFYGGTYRLCNFYLDAQGYYNFNLPATVRGNIKHNYVP
jgi:hypothetical protein